MESQIWCPPAGSVALWGEGLERNNGFCQCFCVGETTMSLMPLNLPHSYCSSEGVSLSKSVYRPFKRNCLGCQKFLSSTASIPTDFYSQKFWRWYYLHGTGTLGWGYDMELGPFTPKISLPIFICHCGCILAFVLTKGKSDKEVKLVVKNHAYPIYVYPGGQDNTDQHRVLTVFPQNTRDNVLSPALISPTLFQTPYALTSSLFF